MQSSQNIYLFETLQQMHREPRYKTVNTFTRKPCPTQIISYFIVAVMQLSFWLCVQPYISNTLTKIIMVTLFSLSSLLLIIFSIATSVLDPSDPVMIQYKNGQSTFNVLQSKQPCLYCEHCDSYVLMTSRHCKICDRCVDLFDHHCIWINNCIGKENYKEFMGMIISVFSMKITYVISVLLLWKMDQWRNYLPQMVVNWFLALVSLSFSLAILGLIFLHFFLISQNLTTFQYIINKRSGKIAPNAPINQTNNSQSNQRQSSIQNGEVIKSSSNENSDSHSHQSDVDQFRTQNSINPPISAFQNITNEEKASELQSFQHIKSTHNKLPSQYEREDGKVVRSQQVKKQKEEGELIPNKKQLGDFYKNHRGLRVLVGSAIMVKPQNSRSSKILRESANIPKKDDQVNTEYRQQQAEKQKEKVDDFSIKSEFSE